MKAGLVTAILLYLSTIAQQALPERMAILGSRPDFLCLAAVMLGLLLRPVGAIWTGGISGLLHGAVAGANLWQYALTRMLGAYTVSRIGETDIEIGPILGAIIVGVGTLGTYLIFMFLAPPSSLGTYFQATIGTALYNCVLALPMFSVLRRILKSRSSGV